MINSPVIEKKGKNLGPVIPEFWPRGTLCRYTTIASSQLMQKLLKGFMGMRLFF
jgi:hypothetical protein